jgi:UPF0148 protein
VEIFSILVRFTVTNYFKLSIPNGEIRQFNVAILVDGFSAEKSKIKLYLITGGILTETNGINDSDYKIQQISRFLEAGGTMLAQHCNVCGAPFFRYHGEIVCPVCSSVEELVHSGEEPATCGGLPETEGKDLPGKDSSIVPDDIAPQKTHPDAAGASPAEDDISTMTNMSCNVCGSPLFSYKGRIFCPMCDEERQLDSAVCEPVSLIKQAEGGEKKPFVPPSEPKAAPEVEKTVSLLLLKMQDAAEKMANENDIKKVHECLDLMERTTVLLERIKKL